jgi:hypothetical protein
MRLSGMKKPCSVSCRASAEARAAAGLSYTLRPEADKSLSGLDFGAAYRAAKLSRLSGWEPFSMIVNDTLRTSDSSVVP